MPPPHQDHCCICSLTHHSFYPRLLHCLLTGLTASCSSLPGVYTQHTQGQHHDCVTSAVTQGPTLRKNQCSVLWSTVTILKYLIIFEHIAMQFHLTLCPVNYVASPEYVQLALFISQIVSLLSSWHYKDSHLIQSKRQKPCNGLQGPTWHLPQPTPTSLISSSIALPFAYSVMFLRQAQSTSTSGPLHSCSFWLLQSCWNIAWLVRLCSSRLIMSEAFSNHSK